MAKASVKNKRTCSKGHTFYKSSDCPACPVCEANRKPQAGLLASLPAPARRALENKGISSLRQLSKYNETDISKLHGMGPSTMSMLRHEMKVNGLSFKSI